MISSSHFEKSMSMTEEAVAPSPPSVVDLNMSNPMDRRTDVELKQAGVAALLQETGCDGLLILDPDNFGWLTGGGMARGILDPDTLPALYFTADARWLLAANADSQRLFDEEIDGLGFQVKEWPWYHQRDQLLADLCQGRNVASDTPIGSCKIVAPELRVLRRTLTDYEIACYRTLGQTVSHALEATGRTLSIGESEREIAGQISHRLLHRGVQPLLISVTADGRGRTYRQASFTSTPITRTCVLTVAARKYGLCVRASRAVAFGQPDANFRRDHDCACKISATYVAGSWPDSVPRQILLTGKRIFQLTGVEHEFYLAPQGHVTGHAPVELNISLHDEQLLQARWAITWCVAVGAAVSCDTFLISEEGPRAITAAENWPLKRIRIQGAEFVRPDVLIR
jgi:Xaa-Pro dipeptidase